MPPGARIPQHPHIGHHNIDQKESYFRKDSLDFISRSRSPWSCISCIAGGPKNEWYVARVRASNEAKSVFDWRNGIMVSALKVIIRLIM